MRELRELAKKIKELEERLKQLKKKRAALTRRGYTIRYVFCGKDTCRVCKEGEGHGPYIYKTVREGKKVKSIYLGKLDNLESKREDRKNASELKRADKKIREIERKLHHIRNVLSELLGELGE